MACSSALFLQITLSPVLLILAFAGAEPGSKSKSSFTVNAQVVSGWPRTPDAAQSLEWLRDVDAAEAGAFLRRLGNGSSLVPGDELAFAEAMIQSSSAKTFHELLVRNSYYSPRIETLRSLERQDRLHHGGAQCEPSAAWALLWRWPSNPDDARAASSPTLAPPPPPVAICNVSALHAATEQLSLDGIAASTAEAARTSPSSGGRGGASSWKLLSREPPGLVRSELDHDLSEPSSAVALAGQAFRGAPEQLSEQQRQPQLMMSCFLVLYGTLDAKGLLSLAPLLREVDALLSSSGSRSSPGLSHCTAVFRHSDGAVAEGGGPGGGPALDLLTGYGFELAIKSSEYKTHAAEEEAEKEKEAQEKEKEERANEAEEAEANEAEEDRSAAPRGGGSSELSGLFAELEEAAVDGSGDGGDSSGADQILTEREVKDLGLQAVAKIVTSRAPLLALMRLSQDFPSFVVGLAKTSVPEQLRKAGLKLRKTIREYAEVFSVNGRLVRPDHADLSLFPMLKTLQPFFVGVERLVRTGLSEALACELLKKNQGIKLPERLDWRSPFLPAASYIVTKDKKSQRWGGSLQHLMYAFPGSLAPVRLPLYSVVFVFDPAEVSELRQAAQLLAQTPLPIKLTFVMLPGSAPPGTKAGAAGTSSASFASWDEEELGTRPAWLADLQETSSASSTVTSTSRVASPSLALAASFGYLLERSPAKARKFLKAASEWTESNERMLISSSAPSAPRADEEGEAGGRGSSSLKAQWPSTEAGLAAVKELFGQSLPQEEQKEAAEIFSQKVLGASATSKGSHISNATEYVSGLGLPVPCLLMNGRLLLKGAYDGPQSIYPAIGQEQQTLQRAVYMGKLAQAEQVPEYIASQGFLTAYHEDITPELAQRGGEEGMPGQAPDVAYLHWPKTAFLQLPFLRSWEEDTEEESERGRPGPGYWEEKEERRLKFFHVTLLRSLSQASLLKTFASHLLSPDRSALHGNQQLRVPPFTSYWAAVVQAPKASADENQRAALAELAACVRAVMHAQPLAVEGQYQEQDELAIAEQQAQEQQFQRQRLFLLKFLGRAVPAALAAEPSLAAEKLHKLCLLGIEKKIELELRGALQKELEAQRKAGPLPSADAAIIATAAKAAGAGRGSGGVPPDFGEAAGGAGEEAAVWVCNGRQIRLTAGGPGLSARHVQALELLEAQYDVSGGATADDEELEDEAEEPAEEGRRKKQQRQNVKPLFQWLLEGASNRVSQEAPKAKEGNEGAGAEEEASPLAPRLPLKAQGLVAAIRSEALSFGRSERFSKPSEIFEQAPKALRLHLPPPKPSAASPIEVYGILDPLSSTAQSASAVLALFGMAFNAEVRLLLNPLLKHSSYPLKRYYREVIHWPRRLADGRSLEELLPPTTRNGKVTRGGGDLLGGTAGTAHFVLATRHTLTAAVHAMPTWLVTAHEAEKDMDNLRLLDVGNGKVCNTTYVLRQLYVEGQAFILGQDGWPIASAKNLQIDVLKKGSREIFDDTIVMGNLGYFQVHGNPGLYDVSLKPGLSNDTFEAVNLKEVQVSSYITPPYQLRVTLRPGRSHEDLFQEGGQESTSSASLGMQGGGSLSRLFGKLATMLGAEADAQAVPAEESQNSVGEGGRQESQQRLSPSAAVPTRTASGLPTVHVFSVASGHLYEKLLGIMILSVRNRTECPLHFWFIDNFLSPKFKAFIPHFAKKYSFDFDFVTYKWPSWLNPQSEKQRLIWAYKILFLDVLFPLDVPKVIFIDADQVVRADVRELWEADLKGRVYGFVPMGNTNPETEGFRFWKQGYWSNHLGSLPYHISALFVVDLMEFRRTSTGDQLRGIYNQLSRDPNSLANLDQDLPNFAQHQIPIFSLPAEWLWCETWCSQESKAKAKTIDLCQNPLTKEPKIVMARRIISEWQTYHDEVQQLQEDLETLGSGMAIASAAEPPNGKIEL